MTITTLNQFIRPIDARKYIIIKMSAMDPIPQKY